MKRKLFFALILFILTASFCFTQETAFSIVDKSRNRIKANTVRTRMTMVLTGRNISDNDRIMEQLSKKDSKGNNRSVIEFQRPATVAGTRFLTIENTGKDNDQWIFLPSLGKVRRIAAADGSGSFVGSDFSYDDISSADRNVDLDTHSILREEKLNSNNCYVIESVSKNKDYQYSKMIQWIDKSNYILYKVELYDRRGNLVKLLEILEFRDVQGRRAPMVTKMTTLAAGTSTSLNVTALRYDEDIPERVFSVNFLETGNR